MTMLAEPLRSLCAIYLKASARHSLSVSLRFQPPQNITAAREASRSIDPTEQSRQFIGVDGKTKRYVIHNASISGPIRDVDGSPNHSTASFLGPREVSFAQVIVTSNAKLPDLVISKLSSPHGQVYGRCTHARHF